MRAHWVLPVDEEDLIQTGLDWLLVLLNHYSPEAIDNFLLVLWRVWSVRNSILRAGQKLSIEGSVTFLTRYMDSLVLLRQKNVQTDGKGKQCMLNGGAMPRTVPEPRVRKRWIPPSFGALKINVDGAFHHESGKAAVGVISLAPSSSLQGSRRSRGCGVP